MRTITVQGVTLPSFMYGTAWKEDQTEALVTQAIAAGFRAIDTANQRRHYFEAGVGAALKAAIDAGTVSRDDLFLQTKFTYLRGQDHRLPYDPEASPAEQVAQSFQSSLEHLHIDHLDSYVLHGPSNPFSLAEIDRITWRAMEAEHAAGRTKLLGVSNVNLDQLVALYDLAETKPAFVQNRCFARDGWNREVRAFCRDRGIVYQGFSLLTANGRELHRPEVAEIAERTGRSVPQLVFRFALQVGMLPLTGTTDEAHMRHDLGIYDFELAQKDVDTLERLAG
ncbi:MAG TPA: aldo/keto reductase [Polyangiaceae bacterium]|nr:aldo/keto reductase [Polyangiaceae bacterium]